MKATEDNLRVLEDAIDVLEQVRDDPCRSFYWWTWGKKYNSNWKPVENPPDAPEFCGTQACVAGWLSLDPRFQRHGLRAIWNSYGRVCKSILEVHGLREVFYFLEERELNELFFEGSGEGRIEDAIECLRNYVKRRKVCT